METIGEFLWDNVSHLSAALVALSLWGLLRFSLATKARYAPNKAVALIAGVAWTAVLLWVLYSNPSLAPFAAAFAVTLFADAHYKAAYAKAFGEATFHERAVELIQRAGLRGYLWAFLPTEFIEIAFSLLLVGLAAYEHDWMYWTAIGFASAHTVRTLSAIRFGLAFRPSGTLAPEP